MTYMTPREVAEHFKVSTRTVERLIERGVLSCVRLGPKLTRIRPADLEAYEASLCLTTASNDPSSTASNPGPGTSAGPKDGASFEEVATMLGDSVEITRKHYAVFSPTYLRGVVNSIAGARA